MPCRFWRRLRAGASTIPEARHQGAQLALVESRLRYAPEHGCDIVMMGALADSSSQRNAERPGFRIAYTRTKGALHEFSIGFPLASHADPYTLVKGKNLTRLVIPTQAGISL